MVRSVSFRREAPLEDQNEVDFVIAGVAKAESWARGPSSRVYR
jgi:hypothetical protein